MAITIGVTAPASCHAAFILTVETDHTGAQTQIDVNHTSSWDFTLTGLQFFNDVRGLFTIKDGPATNENIVFSLWDDDYASPTKILLASVFKTPADITQSFALHEFYLAGVNIGAGNYSLSVTSTEQDQQNDAYFIKGGGGSLTYNPPIDGQGGIVPEPTSLALAGFAGIGMAVGAIRRRRQSKAVAA